MAVYTIAKPNPGDLATTTTFNDIRTALNSERARRSQSATNVPVVTTIDQITASYINNALSYVNGWNGTSHTVAAGSVIQAPHVHLIIDGLNTAGQWNPTPGANGFIEYTVAGTYNWIVPANSGNVRIIAIGGGGGGGGAWSGSNATVGGGGGAGGVLDYTVTLAPGTTVQLVVGGGGAGGAPWGGPGQSGGTGGTTRVYIPSVVDYYMYGGVGGAGQWYGGAGGSGPSFNGGNGNNAINGNVGGPGANSYYTSLYGAGTAGGGGRYNGGGGILGAGGGGGGGSSDAGDRWSGGPGGAGYVRILY